jgi:hypothetical protein
MDQVGLQTIQQTRDASPRHEPVGQMIQAVRAGQEMNRGAVTRLGEVLPNSRVTTDHVQVQIRQLAQTLHQIVGDRRHTTGHDPRINGIGSDHCHSHGRV